MKKWKEAKKAAAAAAEADHRAASQGRPGRAEHKRPLQAAASRGVGDGRDQESHAGLGAYDWINRIIWILTGLASMIPIATSGWSITTVSWFAIVIAGVLHQWY